MTELNPLVPAILALIALGLTAAGFYAKHRINQLDRIIAEKEAAMNATEQPSTPAR